MGSPHANPEIELVVSHEYRARDDVVQFEMATGALRAHLSHIIPRAQPFEQQEQLLPRFILLGPVRNASTQLFQAVQMGRTF